MPVSRVVLAAIVLGTVSSVTLLRTFRRPTRFVWATLSMKPCRATTESLRSCGPASVSVGQARLERTVPVDDEDGSHGGPELLKDSVSSR
ncbi:hypothetical protein GN244_ATG01148 [Phytophthora infestans]|uniref:Uncharacterized protein n=1 Tax=Phytophthora infestans TaxID=4787 RepID=A0A833TB54_PHYIN|nr:hypothetical protein GN244_ATG01148 [Phytophthora infestans]